VELNTFAGVVGCFGHGDNKVRNSPGASWHSHSYHSSRTPHICLITHAMTFLVIKRVDESFALRSIAAHPLIIPRSSRESFSWQQFFCVRALAQRVSFSYV